jgi:hypothetical protein
MLNAFVAEWRYSCVIRRDRCARVTGKGRRMNMYNGAMVNFATMA